MVGRIRMGRTKDYLRYAHESTFGVVAASQAPGSTRFLHMRNTKDRFLAVPANENILFWDLKTKQIVNKLIFDSDIPCEVTVLEVYHGGHPRTNLLAAGYANGHVKVYEYETGLLKSTFAGHRSAVTAIAFDKDGSRLASGGKDTHIVLYDLVGERGLFSLKGHKNMVSKLAFIHEGINQMDIILSSSIDAVSAMKFWDLKTQHCFCTIPGQGNGVWSFALIKDNSRLITASSSSELKVYSIHFLSEVERQSLTKVKGLNPDENEEDYEIDTTGEKEFDEIPSQVDFGLKLEYMGSILRNCKSESSRIQDIVVDSEQSIMICYSCDKNIELYGIRNSDEALTYAKKLAKKEQKRINKRKRKEETIESGADDDDDGIITKTMPDQVTSLELLNPQVRTNCEINHKYGCHKLSNKIKAISMAKQACKDGHNRYKIAVVATTNQIDSYYLEPQADSKEEIIKFTESIHSLSHRSDVRDVCISRDGDLIMTASAESVKIWRPQTTTCICTIDTDHATCCIFANACHISGDSKNRFGLVGTKKGRLLIIDLNEAALIETIEVTDDGKPLTSIVNLPDQTGIATGTEDGVMKIFDFVWKMEDNELSHSSRLSLKHSSDLKFQEGITCVRASADGKFLAVALLDSTVRVHFRDTFKYFLTMFGHKFPVTTMDISDDSNLLITGSPDKNIKIWGLDFGDCHKSIFAHDEAITCVKFVPKTHYAFSCSRDHAIKQWDCDRFIKIQTLPKHQAEVWCLDVGNSGKFLVTGSHDKTIRIYRKTEEILVPSDEEETERELEDERNVFEKQENIIIGESNLETGFATKMTIDTVKSTDRLIEAIDVFTSEQAKQLEYIKLCEIADKKNEPRPAEPEHDPLLMTAMTTDYRRFMLEILKRIRSSELEEILLTLPFDYVRRLLEILVLLLDKKGNTSLIIRCAIFLLKINFGRIAASPALSPTLHKLKLVIQEKSHLLRDCAGFNLAALDHLQHNKKYLSTKLLDRI